MTDQAIDGSDVLQTTANSLKRDAYEPLIETEFLSGNLSASEGDDDNEAELVASPAVRASKSTHSSKQVKSPKQEVKVVKSKKKIGTVRNVVF